MEKFENIDVLNALRRVMDQNTTLNRRYFTSFAGLIRANAIAGDKNGRSILWMSHQSGVECFREREVFLRNTWPHTCWQSIGGQDCGRVLAYAVELAGIDGDKVYGTLYPMDYTVHRRDVEQESIDLDAVEITFQSGDVHTFPSGEYLKRSREIEIRYGEYEKLEYVPSEPEQIEALLDRHHMERSAAVAGSFDAHIQMLRQENVQREAARIHAIFQGLEAPNSPSGNHFMVEISPFFLETANTKDQTQLFRMLPFSTLKVSTFKNMCGLYALISPDEDRSKLLRKPSVRAKLQGQPNTPKPSDKAKAKDKGGR